ncbi:primase C-terminal domain-containing protein, partial [Escherichia coli]|nr:replicase [Escherichia coli]
TRKWAYRAIRQGWPEYEQWLQACYERASAYNLQFSAPLDENEVRGIAKSIAKWTFNIFSKEKFEAYVRDSHSSKIQSIRGRKGGLISKRGASPLSQRTSQPWLDLKISRSTFYRRKKASEA